MPGQNYEYGDEGVDEHTIPESAPDSIDCLDRVGDAEYEKDEDGNYLFHIYDFKDESASDVIDDGGDKEEQQEANKIYMDEYGNTYKLEFIRVPLEESYDKYIKDNTYIDNYDYITTSDEYWDGEDVHSYVKNKHLSPVYIKQNHDSIHYWSMMKKRSLSEVNFGDIERVFEKLSEKELSQSRINAIMKTGLIPLKEAYKQGLILSRCYEFYLPKVERSLPNLSVIEISKIFNSHWENSEAFVANLIAYIGRMQLQEVRALRLCDIGEKTITVENCYTKRGLSKTRIPRIVHTSSYVTNVILKYACTAPYSSYSKDDFIFYSEKRNVPAHGNSWNSELQKVCEKNGIKKIFFRNWSSTN